MTLINCRNIRGIRYNQTWKIRLIEIIFGLGAFDEIMREAQTTIDIDIKNDY